MHNRRTISRAIALPITFFITVSLAYADTAIVGGKPRIAIEAEHEEAPDHSSHANAITVIPGVKWEDGFVNLAEILFEVEREKEKDEGKWHSQTVRKVGIRLQKDFQLTDSLKTTTRVLLGRSLNDSQDYTYAYLEPALKYDFKRFEFTVGYRITRSVDSSEGHDSNKIRLGPSFDISKQDEVEFRWARGWDAHTGKHINDTYIVEYVHKF